MKETKIKVTGMHCKSCEMLVKEELREIRGVKSVEASHKEGLVKITHDDSADLSKAKDKITELGYKVEDG